MWTFQIRTFPLSKPTSSYHSPNQYFLTRATKNHYDNFVDLLKVYHSQIFYATLILDVHYSSSSNLRIKILSGLFSCFLSPNSQLSSYQKGENILERKSQTPLRQNANRLYLYRMEILQSALSISHISYFSVP